MAGPDSPPRPAPSRGRRSSTSITIPSTVLATVTASAPAAAAAPATSGRSYVLGLSFAHRGRLAAAAASTTSAVAVAEWANSRRRSSRLGQEALTSTATTWDGASASNDAARANSSTVRPQMLATTRAPEATRAGRSSSSQALTPGPWRPTLLIIPAGVACTRGGGLPSHGSGCNDLTTTAPRSARSKWSASSAPCPEVPEAVMIGLGNRTEPTVVDKSVPRARAVTGHPPTRPRH